MVLELPSLQTQRLVLRPFTLADAPEVQRLAGDREIAAMTLTIPHPYEVSAAEAWINTHPRLFADKAGVNFAITLRGMGTLIGAIGLGIDSANHNAELGYWLGKPYWNHGYCTEAAQSMLHYGFVELNLHRIYSAHFAGNPASGRVMQKIGMQYEGCRREHTFKWGEFLDVMDYAILKADWQKLNL
jgi:[ribosomal protein S5]-alanine N-acetyltransferase